MTSETAPINPTMLSWARETAGYSREDVADRLKVKVTTVAKWETGEGDVTYGRVDDLAALFKRPTAVLYLRSPPKEDPSFPADFRAEDRTRTPGIILHVRRAKERRLVALELTAAMNEAPTTFGFECNIKEEPEVVGARLRRLLRLADPPGGWEKDADGYGGLGTRKLAAEAAGVLVFQAPGADLESVSGLSLHFDVFPVAVLRASDTTRRRSFTLLHELAHLGLRQGGLCDLHDDGTESFCNRVSAAALMPPDPVHAAVGREGVSGDPTFRQLGGLARIFSVSEQAMLLRLVTLGLVSVGTYMARRAGFQRKELASAREGRKGGTHYQVVVSRNGERYSHLVLDAYHRGILTGHRASMWLGTTVHGLDRIAEDLARKALRRAS